MSLTTNFNVDPYYDDFDDNKNYYRTLFKPGNAVQARELTQIQTTLQDQIKKFGDHIFKTGSIVTGGQIVIQNTAYINIQSSFSGQDINYIHFDQQTICDTANTKRAYVLKSYDADSAAGQPITLIINQLYGEPFTSSDTIYTQNTDPTVTTYYAKPSETDPTGNCQSFSINEGVIYYDGFFVKTQPQTVAVNKYNRQGNSIIGFTVTEDLIDYTEDTTLLDPAQGSSNFQAPGADRYKIAMTLDNRTLDSTDLTKFVEMGVIQNGIPLKIVQTPIYAGIADELARRTSDESGDYVIKNFAISVTDSDANTAWANISLGSGKAYIKGYEFATGIPTIFSVPKPRTTSSVNNHRITSDYGYYVFGEGLYGTFATNQYGTAELSLLNTGQVDSVLKGGNSEVYANTVIGNAKIKLVSFYANDTSANTLDSNNYVYKVYLTDVNTKSIGIFSGHGANAAGGSNTAVFFPTTFAANSGVYTGLSLRILDGAPNNNPGDNATRKIVDFYGNPGGTITTATAISNAGKLSLSNPGFKIEHGQTVTVSGSNVGVTTLTGVTSNGVVGQMANSMLVKSVTLGTLSNVRVQTTSGEFVCDAVTQSANGWTMQPGQLVTFHVGSATGGTGTISSPVIYGTQTYRVQNATTNVGLLQAASGCGPTTTFTLRPMGAGYGSALTTVIGAIGTANTLTVSGGQANGTIFATQNVGSGFVAGQAVTVAGSNVTSISPSATLGTAGHFTLSTALDYPAALGDTVVLNGGTLQGFTAGVKYYVIKNPDGTAPNTTHMTLSLLPGGTGVVTTTGAMTVTSASLSRNTAAYIVGYTGSPTVYYVSGVSNASTFTLSTTPTGTPIEVVSANSGDFRGLTFTVGGANGKFKCVAPAVGLSNGSVVTVSGTYVGGGTIGGSPTDIVAGNTAYANTTRTYYVIDKNDTSTEFRLSETPGGDAIYSQGGPLNGLTFAYGGAISGYSNPTTYYVANTDGSSLVVLSSTLGGGNIITSLGATGLTYTFAPAIVAKVDQPFSVPVDTNFRFVLDPQVNDINSLIVRSGATKLAAANIVTLLQSATGNATIQESKSEPLLIKIGEANISDNTISDFSYSYKRLYQTVTFTGGVSQTLSVGTGESLQDATTVDAKQRYYQVVVTSQGTGSWPVGYTVPAQALTVSSSSRTITVDNGGNMTANIYAVVNASNPSPKTKTFIKANTQMVDPAWGIPSGTVVSVFGSGASGNTNANVALNDGQTIIAESIVVRTPGVPQYLYVSDVHSINAIFDLNGANLTQAAYNTAISSASSNVTSRYDLNTGQKDSYYDWGSIVLKPGQTAPRGPLVVRYNRFSSTGSGYFDVDSYTKLGSQENGGSGLDYGEIPIFKSEDGYDIPLRDYLDFRPVRTNATTTARANTFILDVDEAVLGPKISEPGLDIISDYEYYLPRIDRVVLNKNRQFQVLQGTPAAVPVSPVEPDDAMTLYILTYPPYLTFPSSTIIETFNNRRYTMKDIGLLDKRIQNLELYTSLSIAELATLNKADDSIRDVKLNVIRPKNGIFVDSFTDKDGAKITAPDFNAAIDIISRSCRGSYNINSTKIFSNTTSQNYNVEIDGPLLMLSSSNTAFVTQNKASKTMNINPFNIVNYIGTVKMDPPSDVWHSTNRLEAQNIDLSGGAAARDAWSSIQSTTWGAWNTNWTTTSQVLGTTTVRSVDATTGGTAKYQAAAEAQYSATGVASSVAGKSRYAIQGDVTTITSTTTRESQTLNASRTGILAQIVPQQLTQSFGDRLIDLSVVTYMRQANVLITAEKFKPFTTLHAFFDNVKVDGKIAKVNRFEMFDNNLQYQTQLSNSETVTFYNVSSNSALLATDTVIGTGGVVLTSNNNAFITNMAPESTFGSWSACITNGIWAKGNVTGRNYRINKWYHSTGRALAATSTTITLAYSAGGSTGTDDYVGQTMYIVNGTGKGQSSIITAYDSSTRVATITGAWGTVPDTTSVYTIGLLETTAEGACAGVFLIPADTFRTGEKVLRLIDDEFGNIENSRTNGDFNFFAQGIVDTKQETSVTVFTPTVTRSSVSESFSASTSSIKSAVSGVDVQKNVTIGYYDPLAQTFLINPNQYAQGIVIDSIRVCFKSKDVSAPVTCQIRPVQNGYPSSSTIYPFAEKTLTPDKVITTTIPDVTDPAKYTEFKFDVPILLLPGEHSFVLVSNSNGYECFVGEIGATDLATSVKISEQPYTGSLFLSQNGSTWSPEQMADIMFSIQKRVFTTGTGYGYFQADLSQYSSNTVFDVMQLMTTDAVVANTAVQYDFVSEMETGGQHQLITLIPNEDYECDDGYGRRILSKTTGNSSFQLRIMMRSTNQDISPMIDINRLNLLTIENKINNMPLQNTGFVIINQGSGYAANADVTLSYASDAPGQGSGAAARAVYDSVSGKITHIELTNAGTGYITSPTLTISGGSGTGATAVYNGEDKASGGNANIRYITKKVQLAPGFDAGDLRVYMDAYRPPGSGILVYYKVLSASDASNFDDNSWNLMSEGSSTKAFISQNRYDYAELKFGPGVYGSGKFANKILYTSASNKQFTDFTTFAIKVVMYGTSTVDVPKIAQLRVIALPSSTSESIG